MKRTVLLMLGVFLVAPGCASMTIKPVDFSWSFESVLTTDAAGVVEGEPKTIVFNAGELFRAEAENLDTVAGKTVRIIRNDAGYYFVTSAGFRHVYVFTGADGKLKLKKKVLIDENGMEKPFFNRRDQGVELAANGQVYLLNKKGIVSGGKK